VQALAQRSGRSQSALIREAIDSFLERHQPQGRLARLRQARDLWTSRDDRFAIIPMKWSSWLAANGPWPFLWSPSPSST
jgi:hypothetical protein